MFDFSTTKITRIAVHNVGNASRDEGLVSAHDEMKIESEIIRDLLLKYFLSPFKETQLYHLTHDSDIRLNEIYTYISAIFAAPEKLYENSIHIAQHLYAQSVHPKIKAGEFYVVYLEDCVLEDEVADAIGLFKSENKDTYLKVKQTSDNFEVESEVGTNVNKMEKGCLIFNTEKEKGFVLAMTDAINKQNEAAYWKDAFLKVVARKDVSFFTQNYMELCKHFIEENAEDAGIDKAEEVTVKNKIVQFFTEKEEFNTAEFEQEVLAEPEKIAAFREYKKEYQDRTEVEIPEDFEIAPPAVKSTKRQFKNQIKLDNNFNINILKNTEHLIRGFDEERNMKYYQLFYEEEK